MLTPDDIKNLIEAQKEIFYTKQEMDQEMDVRFDAMHEKFSNLQTSVDSIVENNQTKSEEVTVLSYRMKKTEDWIDLAAPKLDIEFQH